MNLTYERMMSSRPAYTLALDGNVIGTVFQEGQRSWTARTTARPRLSCPGETRHAAALALIEKLTEHGILTR